MYLSPLGTIFSKNSFYNNSDLTLIGMNTIVSGALRNVDSNNMQTQLIIALGPSTSPLNTVLDEFTVEWQFSVNTLPLTNNGSTISISMSSSNMNNQNSFQAIFSPFTKQAGLYDPYNPNNPNNNPNTPLTELGNTISFNKSDKIIFTLNRTLNDISCTFTNLNNGTSATSALYRPSTHRGSVNYVSNTANILFTIPAGAGVYDTTSLKYSSSSFKNVSKLLIGDSISYGFSALPYENSFAKICNLTVNAGSGDYCDSVSARKNEIKLINPEKIFLMIGANDLPGAIGGKYAAMVNDLTTNLPYTTIVHLLATPRNGMDVTNLNMTISGYSRVIDTNTSLRASSGSGLNPAYNSGDGGIHPNTLGHRVIANAILESPFFYE